jgi:hypothetical protein
MWMDNTFARTSGGEGVVIPAHNASHSARYECITYAKLGRMCSLPRHDAYRTDQRTCHCIGAG